MDKKEKAEEVTAIALPLPIRIMVGMTYRIVVDNHITKCFIEKIHRSRDGEDFVVITIKKIGWFQGTVTSQVSTREFKDRLILGGLAELEI